MKAPGDPRPGAEKTLTPGTPDSAEPTETRTFDDVAARAAAASWGDFQLRRELGHGGFGRVYLAWDPVLAREVALKVVQLRDPSRLRSALREGQMLARVRHRNVVVVYGARLIGDEVGLAMELITGRDLADVVRQAGPMGAEEATFIGISLCRALAAVHAAGLLHRDVKAHNVMRESGGRIVLMDFGAGRDIQPDAHRTSDATGTPLYLAPEILRGQPASRASDIYSLGVLLFFLVTGEYPVAGRRLVEVTLEHAAGRRRHLADCRPDLPNAFVRVVERALDPRPEARYESAGALLSDLAAAMPLASVRADQEAGSAAAPESPVSGPAAGGESAGTATPPASARLVPWAIGLAATAIGTGVLGFLSTGALDMSLGRPHDFTDASPWVWWVTGLQSLVPPLVYAVLFLVAIRIVLAIWQLLQRVVPPLQQASDASHASISAILRRASGGDVNVTVRWLLVLQTLALVAVVWVFGDLLTALIEPVATGSHHAIEVLDHGGNKLYFYQLTLSLLLATSVLAWRRLLWPAARRQALDRTAAAAGLAMIALTVVMVAVPFRLFYESQFPQVDVAGARCFEIGARGDDVLLFCPDVNPPRTRIEQRGDPRLTWRAPGWIFSTPSPSSQD
jgi:predicted Ser/Thr protein kinase